MFNNTDRKDGQIEAAEQQVQDVLKTASQELRGSRKAEGHDVTAQPQMDFERGSQTVQFEDRPSVKIDSSRDALLTEFGKATLTDRYLMPGETYQSLFARVASFYGDDEAHAQRLYDYISKLWFMPSTPVLSNGGTNRGLPISCFLNEANDSLSDIVDLWNQNVWLAARGGGIGSYWGNLRSIGAVSYTHLTLPTILLV